MASFPPSDRVDGTGGNGTVLVFGVPVWTRGPDPGSHEADVAALDPIWYTPLKRRGRDENA